MPPEDKTTITEIELNDILQPGADSVIVPAADGDAGEKPNIFKRGKMDLTFLDNMKKSDPPSDGLSDIIDSKPGEDPNDLSDIIDAPEDPDKKPSRKLDKNGLQQLTTKLFEKKMLIPFDDGKALEDYTLQDYEELLETNFQAREAKIRKETPSQFFESLSSELQIAARYEANGGTDMKGLFRTLAATEEVRALDPDDANDQETIVRSYLQATKFGDDEEIQEEIDGWADRNELGNKASKFKPKLDAMQQQIVTQKLKHTEQLRQRQSEQANAYTQDVYDTLEPAELNGLKLDKKVQNMLFVGLTQPRYPSVNGKQTNLLGHLLEKYQFVEPRHDLVAEALYLLADPEGYREEVRKQAKVAHVKDTTRKLKSEEANKSGSSIVDDDPDPDPANRPLKLQRPVKNFFQRQ